MHTPVVFTAALANFNTALWGFHLPVEAGLVEELVQGTDRRVVATLNGSLSFQCALMPRGDGHYFINVNKKIRDKLKLQLGSLVEVSLVKDESTYGLPMPEELAELLAQDPEGDGLFHALTPGRQRTLLYFIGQPKSSELRLTRALRVVDHLKVNGGKVNYRVIYGKED